jgi:hypothetical protein
MPTQFCTSALSSAILSSAVRIEFNGYRALTLTKDGEIGTQVTLTSSYHVRQKFKTVG